MEDFRVDDVRIGWGSAVQISAGGVLRLGFGNDDGIEFGVLIVSRVGNLVWFGILERVGGGILGSVRVLGMVGK